MLISMVMSALIDAVAIHALGVSSRFREAVVVAGYASLVVHLITAGFFMWRRSPPQSVALVVAGFIASHPPSVLTERIATALPKTPLNDTAA